MRVARIVVALVASVVMTLAVGATASADPPGMTHNGIVPDMTHN
ncbi:hypothetical protein [Actinophytocola sp.]